MNRLLRGVGALGLAAAAGLAIAALSQVPLGAEQRDGVLRLSWRTRSEQVQHCRTLSPQEIAEQPVHMRRTEECDGRVLPYRLQVHVDGRLQLTQTIRGGGARGDRPIYVLHEMPLPAGQHRVAVRFVREGSDDDGEEHSSGDREDDREDDREHAEDREHRGVAPARLELRQRIVSRPGEVVLVTYDADRERLVIRTPARTTTPP